MNWFFLIVQWRRDKKLISRRYFIFFVGRVGTRCRAGTATGKNTFRTGTESGGMRPFGSDPRWRRSRSQRADGQSLSGIHQLNGGWPKPPMAHAHWWLPWLSYSSSSSSPDFSISKWEKHERLTLSFISGRVVYGWWWRSCVCRTHTPIRI